MRRIITLAFIFAFTAVPALAESGNHAANQGSRDQHAIDNQRDLAAQALANEAKNTAKGYTDLAANNAASAVNHQDKADALLAGCPTCH